MAEYKANPLRHLAENVAFAEDGGVYLNYLMTGPLFTPYDVAVIDVCQKVNAALFSGMSMVEAETHTSLAVEDVFVGGFKTRTSIERIISRITTSVPDFSSARYPALQRHIEYLQAALESGEIPPEIDRLFWLHVRMPAHVSSMDRFTSSLFNVNPHRDVTRRDVLAFRERVERAIPDGVGAWRTNPTDMDWVYNRSILRGDQSLIPVYDLPVETSVDRPIHAGVEMGTKNFRPYVADEGADTKALTQQLVGDLAKDTDEAAYAERAKHYKRSFRRNFKTLKKGNVISVHVPDERMAAAPDGIVMYQQVLAFTRFPTAPTDDIGAFTEVANAVNGLDGDFVLRIMPNQEDVSAYKIEQNAETNASISEANARSEYSEAEYISHADEIASYANNVINLEEAPRGLRVTGLIAFGHAHLETLIRTCAATMADVKERGFTLRPVPGGGVDLWHSMFPSTPLTPLVRALSNPTTAERLAGFVPIRRLDGGDDMGPPIFHIAENALSKYVHFDQLTATKRGNGSIMISGAQGGSKTYTGKHLLSWGDDMLIPFYVLDPQGEWATYVAGREGEAGPGPGFDSYQIVRLIDSNVITCPLQVFAHDPAQAQRSFVEWFSVLFGVKRGTTASLALQEVSHPQYRKDFDLNCSRDVLRHIVAAKNYEWKELEPLAKEALKDPLLAAFLDRCEPGSGREVFTPKARIVVFVTAGARMAPAGKSSADYDAEEAFTAMANVAVARITEYCFDRIDGPAYFLADELSGYVEHPDALGGFIEQPDAKGRKNQKAVIAISQRGEHLRGRAFKNIAKKVIYRQERSDNSIDALEWGDMPVTPRMVLWHTTQTSPLDTDPRRHRMPIKGREAEGWVSMPGCKLRVKGLPEVLPGRARTADTTAGIYRRYTGHGEATRIVETTP